MVGQAILAHRDLAAELLELVAAEDQVIVDLYARALKLGDAQLVVLDLLREVLLKRFLVFFELLALRKDGVPLLLLVFLEEVDVGEDLTKIWDILQLCVVFPEDLEDELEEIFHLVQLQAVKRENRLYGRYVE